MMIFTPDCIKRKISQWMAVNGTRHRFYTIDICMGGCPVGFRSKTNASSTPSTMPAVKSKCVTTRYGFKNVTHFKGTQFQIKVVGVKTALECGCRRQNL